MDEFQKLQAFAASWGSLYCGVLFFIAVAFALWPSRQRIYDEAAQIPLKDD